jgi:hypothetical protein
MTSNIDLDVGGQAAESGPGTGYDNDDLRRLAKVAEWEADVVRRRTEAAGWPGSYRAGRVVHVYQGWIRKCGACGETHPVATDGRMLFCRGCHA